MDFWLVRVQQTFKPFSWRCLYCGRPTTINADDVSYILEDFSITSKDEENRGIYAEAIRCPNGECGELSLDVCLVESSFDGADPNYRVVNRWKLLPRSNAIAFPEYVPAPIRRDYEEASLIYLDSPKAAATLARRCLQGMIRDRWRVARATLFEEIQAIEDKVEPGLWEALDAVRRLGNIGAHMQRDVNVIVDVEAGEAERLIKLVEALVQEWYVARRERELRVQAVVELGAEKDAVSGRKLHPPQPPRE